MRPAGPGVLVVAGVASGVGKTMVTLGLAAAWRRRGLTVQAFKVGPDFIDGGLHAVATGRPCYNLDGWMCGRDGVRASVARHAAGADLAVVEGMMGCFDGVDGRSEDGSTAQVAKWLGAPVVLVVDARAQVRSAAAVVRGFEAFDPDLRVGAAIFNHVGSPTHARWLAEAVEAATGVAAAGALPHEDTLVVVERHLGLVTAAEGWLTGNRLGRIADAIEAAIDLDALAALASPVPGDPEPAPGPERRPPDSSPGPARARIGVARDAAFQFYYAENLDRLRQAGGEIVEWSPLTDAALPDVDGLYLGGGYPELHAPALAANVGMRAAVRAFAAAGRPIYAECGGLMYLADAIEGPDGGRHPMVGLLPATVHMGRGRLTLGYREVCFARTTPLGPPGVVARGHEFHASTLDPVPPTVPRAWHGGRGGPDGYLVGRAVLSYVHLHFASNPGLAPALVESCARSRA